jgi:hypothetical protein
MSRFKSWLYENDIVCFVFKGAENLPARGRKTEKNITLTLYKNKKQNPKNKRVMHVVYSLVDFCASR